MFFGFLGGRAGPPSPPFPLYSYIALYSVRAYLLQVWSTQKIGEIVTRKGDARRRARVLSEACPSEASFKVYSPGPGSRGGAGGR